MNKLNTAYWTFVVGMILATSMFAGMLAIVNTNCPQAIDVYQGKTTLKYTVIDGVVTDSTVVWKSL